MSQAGAGDLPDMVYTGQVPSASCHVPRDHVSHRRSLEPRHHHPRLRQRRLLRLPHHHPDPLPLLPEVTVMMIVMMMIMMWEQEARQRR